MVYGIFCKESEKMIDINVVLVEPEIPPNTGNIARTCAATGVTLHLVEPLGFSIDDKQVKRAGLDYWPYVKIEIHKSLDEFLKKYENEKMFFCSTKAKQSYAEAKYPDRCFLVFGKETKGLPETLLNQRPDDGVRIPMIMKPELRSLNLSNAANIVLFEALRQNGFEGLE